MAFKFTTLTWEKIQTILSWFDADTGDATFAGDVSVGGTLNVDDTTEATTTTDGSSQTDGGLSVVKSAVIGGDLTVGTTHHLNLNATTRKVKITIPDLGNAYIRVFVDLIYIGGRDGFATDTNICHTQVYFNTINNVAGNLVTLDTVQSGTTVSISLTGNSILFEFTGVSSRTNAYAVVILPKAGTPTISDGS